MKEIIKNLKNHQPELKDPEGLTADIMSAIDDFDIRKAVPEGKARNMNILRLQRFFAAASIALIVVFGVEQYLILDKIQKLERQAKKISLNNVYSTKLDLMLKVSSGVRLDLSTFDNVDDILKSKSRLLKARLILAQFNVSELSHIDKYKIFQYKDPHAFRTLMHDNFLKLEKSQIH